MDPKLQEVTLLEVTLQKSSGTDALAAIHLLKIQFKSKSFQKSGSFGPSQFIASKSKSSEETAVKIAKAV